MARPLTRQELLLRRKISGHVRRLKEKYEYATQKAMADHIKVDPGHLSNIYNGIKTPGIDFLVRLREKLGESVDLIIGKEPDEKWYPPRLRYLGAAEDDAPREGQQPFPSQASSPAQAERQTPEGQTYLSSLDGQSEPKRGMQRVIRRRRRDKPASGQPGTKKAPKGRPPRSGQPA